MPLQSGSRDPMPIPLVVEGESGAGKSETVKAFIEWLSGISPWWLRKVDGTLPLSLPVGKCAINQLGSTGQSARKVLFGDGWDPRGRPGDDGLVSHGEWQKADGGVL